MHCKRFVYVRSVVYHSVCAHVIGFFSDILQRSFTPEALPRFTQNQRKKRQFEEKEMKQKVWSEISGNTISAEKSSVFSSTIWVSEIIFPQVVYQCYIHILNQNKHVLSNIYFLFTLFLFKINKISVRAMYTFQTSTVIVAIIILLHKWTGGI